MRNIGIFAHVDAGKTTLSEQLLVHSGKLRSAGSVDRGTAFTDDLPVERRRGISVRASCVAFTWKNTEIRLIDTPGHTDFSAEIERSFWALDAAILLVDAAKGVEPQTQALFRALREQGLPFLIFLNKMDRDGVNLNRTLKEIENRLTDSALPLWDSEKMLETAVSSDDQLLERYLDGEDISDAEIRNIISVLTSKEQVYPVLYGSALHDEGIETLLNAIVEFLPPPKSEPELCGVAFSTARDVRMGRGLWVRLFGGSLENRMAIEIEEGIDPMTGETRKTQRKITRLRGANGQDLESLRAGDVGIVFGLGDLPIGFVFGNAELLPRKVSPGLLREPLITASVFPKDKEKLEEMRTACAELSSEDPLLSAQYLPELSQVQIRVMGKVQLEILEEIFSTRFNLEVSFGDPKIIYRETIREKARGFVAYTMPKPCWAILEFEIEPAERGSGVSYSSIVAPRDILLRYQHQVESAIPRALSQGRLGWQATDLKITLVGGGHHLIHTHPLDFVVATPMAIQDGLKNGGSVLLEPILECRFIVPLELVGRVMSDVLTMRGEMVSTSSDEESASLTALIPAATSLDYPTSFASFTSGRGSMNTRLFGYRECPAELGETAPRRGVDPLDRSKYILAARSALDGNIY